MKIKRPYILLKIALNLILIIFIGGYVINFWNNIHSETICDEDHQLIYRRYYNRPSLYDYLPVNYSYANNKQIFKNTKAWKLAKKVYAQDTDAIKSLIKKDPSLLNVREQQFEMTLLHWAMLNKRYFSAMTLVAMGADVNARQKFGATPFIDAAEISCSSELLLHFLIHGGFVNDIITTPQSSFNSPLDAAVCNSLENTKILVNAGAVIDTIPYGNITILGSSLLSRKYDIIMYLLKIGINIDTPIYISYGQKVYADEYLRYIQYEPYKHEIPEINKVLKYIDEHKKVMRPTDTMVIKKIERPLRTDTL
jgi:hypothetical protein